ncbi:MAG: alpha/beta hydrolase-fold protein, partial [SAR324 cluster bacterium]|nr:alpha/beta hydrolase-fold protein [SAR324 cluster bacterium]
YLGENREDWKKHDANELLKTSDMKIPMLIDQGSADDFLERELNFELFEKTCKSRNYPATFRMQEGYDHSYFFISSFIEDHLRFHSENLTG